MYRNTFSKDPSSSKALHPLDQEGVYIFFYNHSFLALQVKDSCARAKDVLDSLHLRPDLFFPGFFEARSGFERFYMDRTHSRHFNL